MSTSLDELGAAAQRLRDVAPQITGPLAGLADPVADWLDHARETAQRMHRLFGSSEDPAGCVEQQALAVARVINGSSR